MATSEEKKEIKRMYSQKEGRMIVLPTDIRPTVAAYKRFKTPAFFVPRKGDNSEGEEIKG